MTNPQADFDKDEPLSPEAEAVMARARRRAGISMLVMLIGFMAVVLVVVYRLVSMSPELSERYAMESIALPAGAEVIATQVQDGLVIVTYSAGGGQAIRIFEGKTGEMVREIAVVAE